jgi:RNA polymerase sigma factor (sigma-70 family)
VASTQEKIMLADMYHGEPGRFRIVTDHGRVETGSRPITKGTAMRDDASVIALVARVGAGDQAAWNELIERYSPLVWSICLRYRLDRDDIDDVGQSVWMLLIERIGTLREPAALPGWLATTTKHECLRVLRVSRRHEHGGLPPEDRMPPDPDAELVDADILAAERDVALRTAFDELPHGCHQLLSMLVSDPPSSYADISATLGVAVGSIGPTRARCLDRLRRSPHLASVLDDRPAGTRIQPAGRCAS